MRRWRSASSPRPTARRRWTTSWTSPLAAEALAADEEDTRFWAQVLTGYSSRIPGEPPAQVGPRKLAHLLLGHVPNIFTLSGAQRRHLEPAVTAWTAWSAAQRGLDEAATARLAEACPRCSAASSGPTTTRTRSRPAATWPTWRSATPTCPSWPGTWHAACSPCRCRARPRTAPVRWISATPPPAGRWPRPSSPSARRTPGRPARTSGRRAPCHRRAVGRRSAGDLRRGPADVRRRRQTSQGEASGADRHDIIHTLAERPATERPAAGRPAAAGGQASTADAGGGASPADAGGPAKHRRPGGGGLIGQADESGRAPPFYSRQERYGEGKATR